MRHFIYSTPYGTMRLVIIKVTNSVYVVRCNDVEEIAGSFAEAEVLAVRMHRLYVGSVWALVR